MVINSRECPECKGQGGYGRGRGRRTCFVCRGGGYVVTCPKCGGDQVVRVRSPGPGASDEDILAPCGACRQTGYVQLPHPSPDGNGRAA